MAGTTVPIALPRASDDRLGSVMYFLRRNPRMIVGGAIVVAWLAAEPAATHELEVATSVSMLEGPTSNAEGNVFLTDILMQRIKRFPGTAGSPSSGRTATARTGC